MCKNEPPIAATIRGSVSTTNQDEVILGGKSEKRKKVQG